MPKPAASPPARRRRVPCWTCHVQHPLLLAALHWALVLAALLAHADADAAPEAVCALPPGPDAAASTTDPARMLVYVSPTDCELAIAALTDYAIAAGAPNGTTLRCADLYDTDYTNLFGADCAEMARRLNHLPPHNNNGDDADDGTHTHAHAMQVTPWPHRSVWH